jgi:hypothetical protein
VGPIRIGFEELGEVLVVSDVDVRELLAIAGEYLRQWPTEVSDCT